MYTRRRARKVHARNFRISVLNPNGAVSIGSQIFDDIYLMEYLTSSLPVLEYLFNGSPIARAGTRYRGYGAQTNAIIFRAAQLNYI